MYLHELNIVNGNGKDTACETCLEISFPYSKNIRQNKDGDDATPRMLQPEFCEFRLF